MKEFEQIIEKIFEYTHEYATKNLKLTPENPPAKWTEEEKYNFKEYVHIGFKKAQELVCDELLKYEMESDELKQALRQSRRDKNKTIETNTQHSIELIQYKISILRIFMDSIAWQLLGGQYYKVRRFYDMRKKQNSRPTLSKSNIESVKRAAEYCHSLSPLNFALISDLTSFIDIGDILLASNEGLIPIEVKEGRRNEEIFNFLFKGQFPEKIEAINGDFLKQSERILKQAERGQKLVDVLKTEQGIDPFTALKTYVNQDAFELKRYTDELNRLIANLDTKNYSYAIVEDVISIGIYQKQFINAGNVLIPLLNMQLFGREYPVFNFRHKFQIPITEPIFSLGLEKKTIFDILFGRIKIVMSINLDKFIELCNSKGLHARYLTEKETIKRKQRGEISLFEFEKKNIAIGDGILGDGLIARIVFDFVRPSSVIEFLKSQGSSCNWFAV